MLELFELELTRTSPDRLAFLTFTRAARLEALERTKRPEAELPFVKTIHAICYRVLNVRQDQLISLQDLKKFGKDIGAEIRGSLHDPWSLESVTSRDPNPTAADRLLQLNHLGRHRRLGLRETLRYAPSDLDFHYAKWFTESYKKWKVGMGLMDYTDLLTKYLEVGKELDIDVLFIDEAQDLSRLQWEVVHKLGAVAQRRYLAGDDDQAIFVWAGASADAFNEEPAEESRVLPVSYRIPRSVHGLSQRIIKRVRGRHDKQFQPRDVEGECLQIGFLGHEHLGGPRTFVLFRNHYRGVELAKQLQLLGWPFGGSYSPSEGRGVHQVLQGYNSILSGHAVSPSEAKELIYYAHPSYLKRKAEDIAAVSTTPVSGDLLFSDAVKGMPFEQAFPKVPDAEYLGRAIRTCGIGQVINPSVTLMSVHQSKGREAHTVIMDLEMSRRTYEHYLHYPDEEHRVFYVGATRAKERLLTLLPTDARYYNL